MMRFVSTAFSILVPYIAVFIVRTHQEECILKQRDSIPYSLFSMNGEPLETHGKAIYIISNVTTSRQCTLSLQRVLGILDFPEHTIIGLFHFTCVKKIRVQFNAENTTKLDNVISYFQLDNCIIDIEDLDAIEGLADLRVVTFFHSDFERRIQHEINQSCTVLTKSVSLWIDVESETNPPDLFEILECQNIFPEMAEVTFTNMSWTVIPTYIQSKFPNLQSLEVPYNSLSVPPNFPWSDSIVKLPDSLTRSPYFQDHYSKSFHLDIPADVFRRIIVLDNNNITDLRNFTFSGVIHMISIKSNGLKHIGTDTMGSVLKLQTLILSYNILRYIPETVFRNLKSLRHLDLRHNNLTHLKSTTFGSLVRLEYLNLAHNTISTLENGIFANLKSLQKLHLEMNAIKTLPTNFIAADGIQLNYISLSNNPLSVFPHVFFLQNIKMVDLTWTQISLDNFTQVLEKIPLAQFRTRVGRFDMNPIKGSVKSSSSRPEINLSHSGIRRIGIETNISQKVGEILASVLTHFRLVLDNNPIMCDCNILPFNTFVKTMPLNGLYHKGKYFFNSGKCYYPKEFRGRNMLDIQAHETYCAVNISHCPSTCKCSRRHSNANIIVDCQAKGIHRLPDKLPHGLLELRFQENQISELSYRNYFHRVELFYLSGNNVAQVENGALLAMRSVKELRLDRNRLTYLHKDVMGLSRSTLRLEHNPFRCDCKTIWMKKWIIREKARIQDWENVICNTGDSSDGERFVLVPDKAFVCRNSFNFSIQGQSGKYVVMFTSIAFVMILIVVIISWILLIRGRSEKYQLSVGLGHQNMQSSEKSKN